MAYTTALSAQHWLKLLFRQEYEESSNAFMSCHIPGYLFIIHTCGARPSLTLKNFSDQQSQAILF